MKIEIKWRKGAGQKFLIFGTGAAVGAMITLIVVGAMSVSKSSGTITFQMDDNQAQTSSGALLSNVDTSGVSFTEITDHDIKLDNYNGDLLIREPGDYTLSGNLQGSVIVKTDSPDETILRLNNVRIVSQSGPAIARYDEVSYLGIDLIGDNELYGAMGDQPWAAGSRAVSGHVATLYAEHWMWVGGEGSLKIVNPDSQNGSGIGTGSGLGLYSGDIVALGMDILELPMQNASTQKSVGFGLDEVYPSDSKIRVTNSRGVVMTSLTAERQFRTVLVSNPQIVPGDYYIYINGEKIKTVEVK